MFEAEGGCAKWRGSLCTGNVSWEDVFKGEMLSLLGLEIIREVGKMLPQRCGLCKEEACLQTRGCREQKSPPSTRNFQMNGRA